MANLKRLEAKRNAFVLRITETYRYGTKALTEPNYKPQFETRFVDLDTTFEKFNELHNDIIMICTEDSDFDAQDKVRKDTESYYYECKVIYRKLFPVQETGSVPLNIASGVKLPKISIPTFKGDQKLWPTFFDLFSQLIHQNKNLSNIEKLQYLFSYLDGEPLKLLAGLSISDDSYEIAYKKLVNRYQNKRLLASNALSAILSSSLKSDSARDFRSLLNIFSESLASLEALQFKIDQWDFIIFHILLEKLDVSTRTSFEIEFSKVTFPTYENLYQFLENKCRALESVQHLTPKNKYASQQSNKGTNNNTKTSTNKTSYRPQFQTLCNSTVVSQTQPLQPPSYSNIKCFFCSDHHVLSRCSKFLDNTPEERYAIVKQAKLCLNCLHSSHTVQDCPSTFRCRNCRNKHHTLLHIPKISQEKPTLGASSANSVQVSKDQTSEPSTNNFHALTSTYVSNDTSTILLATATVEILDGRGNFQPIRVLIDSGSQSNFLNEKCLRHLNLPRKQFSASIYGLNQMSSISSRGITQCVIKPQTQTYPTFSIDAIVVPDLCSNIPSFTLEQNEYPHLEGLELADKEFYKSRPVDLLLGAEVFSQILKGGKVVGNLGQPNALETIFGYVLLGKVDTSLHSDQTVSLFTTTEVPLEVCIPKFWEIETLPKHIHYSPDDEKCETLYQNGVERLPTGRFMVPLPFRDGEPDLGDTYSQALRRFLLLEARLLKNSDLYLAYTQFMKEYLESGHMSLVHNTNPASLGCYLPHHCVLKPDSVSTKLRVVWDGSAKGPKGLSLNDTLLPGPKLQKDISSLLLVFRLYPVVFIADIKQMFRQVLVTPSHRNFQKILWRFSTNEPIAEYQLNTVTFGLSSSPYLAMRSLNELADRESDRYPNASRLVKSQVYIDDIIGTCHSVTSALELQRELIELLKSGGFELRKWASNSSELLNAISENEAQMPLSFDDKCEPHFIKVLGLQWHPQIDTFSYQCRLSDKTCTKRTILSDIGRIFDPLGFLCPILLSAKYLMQCIWTAKVGWDESPPLNIVDRWLTLKSELPNLSSIQLRRQIESGKDCVNQLHGFCDASNIGYAAVIYLRTQTQKRISVSLVCAKARVAPLKTLSLARLELLGAYLLSDLFEFVSSVLSNHLEISDTYAWTDSQIVLAWLSSSPSRWKTFVANRVSHIQDIIPSSSWCYVPSGENPADCASRGMTPSQLLAHDSWWNGPSFLSTHIESFQHFFGGVSNSIDNVDFEEKRFVLTTVVTQDKTNVLDTLLERFSNLSKVLRILCYCLRFPNNITKPSTKRSGTPSQHELSQSLMVLIKHVQRSVFSETISKINRGQTLSKPLRRLAPFLDSEGFLRVGGRLRNSNLSYSAKHPLLLPKSHRLTTLIIEDTHVKYCHPGLKTLHYLIVQQFWIISARKTIEKILSKCIRCFRARPKFCGPPVMGDLPSHRIRELKPFSHIAIDFCGPFFITPIRSRGAKVFKSYVCIFVCTATKAIHLELTSDLSTESFIAAFRRFIARRGHVSDCYTDNGTNFVGANRQLLDMARQASEKLQLGWHFSPPSGPHFNGLAEAGVKMFKSHFVRVVGDQRLSHEEFSTLMCQIESILNSRPLCAQSTDPNDLQPLTPGHFLTLEPLTAVIPNQNLTDIPLNRLSRWQLLQKLHSDFWKRYSLEYLHTLQQRNKWNSASENIQLHSLVLIRNDLLPPLKWPLGRVVEIHPGADDRVRVATVRTATGLLKRPVIKLCPLPIS